MTKIRRNAKSTIASKTKLTRSVRPAAQDADLSVKSSVGELTNQGSGGRVIRQSGRSVTRDDVRRPDPILREHAGKFLAWTPDGLTIVAVASTFEEVERKASLAGYPEVAIARIPKGRTIG